jgi:AcrR family transcriptional regulator
MGKAEQIERAPSEAKRRILTAAAKLFRARGFARSTVRELADAVGILSGSLFHHFKSKDDILFAVMEEVIVDMDTALAAALKTAQTTEDKLRSLIHNQLSFIHGPQGDATAVLVYEWNTLSPEGQSRLLERRRHFFARWQDVLEQAHEQGLIAVEPRVLRQLLHGAAVWTANWYKPGGTISLEDLENSILEMARK